MNGFFVGSVGYLVERQSDPVVRLHTALLGQG